METVKGDEDPGSSSSGEGEDEDHSEDDESAAPERDTTEERVGQDPEASADGHGLDTTARGSDLNHGGQKETAIAHPSCVDESVMEGIRSNTGSGVLSATQSVSVEAEVRNLEVSEVGVPEKGE